MRNARIIIALCVTIGVYLMCCAADAHTLFKHSTAQRNPLATHTAWGEYKCKRHGMVKEFLPIELQGKFYRYCLHCIIGAMNKGIGELKEKELHKDCPYKNDVNVECRGPGMHHVKPGVLERLREAKNEGWTK